MRSPLDQISRSGSVWLFPSGHIAHSTSSIRSFTKIRQKCSSIFSAKPRGPDQPLKFSMALHPRPYQPQRFIHQKLRPNPTKMLKHLQCEAVGPDQPLRFSTALPLRPYHPQRFIHQKLHVNRTNMFKHIRCEARRTRSAVSWFSASSEAFNAKPTGPNQLLVFSMLLPLRPYHP